MLAELRHTVTMTEEVRTDFHQLMDEVRADLVQMGGLVAEGISAVAAALLSGDIGGADQIIAADDELDLLSLEAEEKCVRLLALQQPVAVDLRTILTDLRMISELERSGDLVTNIAKAVARLHGTELEPRVRGLIDRMRQQAVRLTVMAMDAYADRDAGLASVLNEIDDVLDDLHNEYIVSVFASHERGKVTIADAVQLAVVGRFFERIGDHAVNVAQRVEFLVTGELPEHSGANRARARREQGEM